MVIFNSCFDITRVYFREQNFTQVHDIRPSCSSLWRRFSFQEEVESVLFSRWAWNVWVSTSGFPARLEIFQTIFAIKMPQFPRRTYDLRTILMLGWELSFALVQSRLSLLNSACSTCSISICVLHIPMIPGELQFRVFKPQLWWYIYILCVCWSTGWSLFSLLICHLFTYIIYIYIYIYIF